MPFVAAILLGLLGLAQANHFTSQLFTSVATKETRDNLVISPTIIRASLALLYAGAEGRTASELKEKIELNGKTKDAALAEFRKLPYRIRAPGIKMLTVFKLYVDASFKIKSSFNVMASKFLRTTIGKINFKNVKLAAKHINAYIESSTLHKFRDTLNPAELSSVTQSFLIQGFYFRGTFAKPFYRFKERKEFFYDPFSSVSVATYIKDDVLPYGKLPQLMSSVIEIPYKDSQLSLVIILPIERSYDLHLQEELLKESGFPSFNLKKAQVRVQIPRFKIEYETYLRDAFDSLDMSRIFNNNEFSELSSTPGLRITNIKHKGLFEVIDESDECTQCIEPSANNTDVQHYFIAGHPFIFAVKDQTQIYFVGRVLKPL